MQTTRWLVGLLVLSICLYISLRVVDNFEIKNCRFLAWRYACTHEQEHRNIYVYYLEMKITMNGYVDHHCSRRFYCGVQLALKLVYTMTMSNVG